MVTDQAQHRSARMAMAITIVSFSIFFITGLISYAVVWNISKGAWRLGEGGGLPWPVYVATGILLCGSLIAAQLSAAERAGKSSEMLQAGLLRLALLGIVFLMVQASAWMFLAVRLLSPAAKNMVSFTFYMLTGLHALHVIAGVLGTLILWRSYGKHTHLSVWIGPCAWYWHFMDVSWLVFLGVMAVTM